MCVVAARARTRRKQCSHRPTFKARRGAPDDADRCCVLKANGDRLHVLADEHGLRLQQIVLQSLLPMENPLPLFEVELHLLLVGLCLLRGDGYEHAQEYDGGEAGYQHEQFLPYAEAHGASIAHGNVPDHFLPSLQLDGRGDSC